jgi:hypothetical protein
VEVDTADRAIVFLEPVNQSAHPVIPQLNGGGVKGNEDPWSGGRVVSLEGKLAGKLV